MREAEGLSRKKLSSILGIASSKIIRTENSEFKNINSRTIGRVVEYFEITADELLTGDLEKIQSVENRIREEFAPRFDRRYIDNVCLNYRETRDIRAKAGYYAT